MAIKVFQGGRCQLFGKLTKDFLSLGKVHVKEPDGSATLKKSYADSALTTANANPVILDQYGRAEIWVNGDALFRVEDKDGVLEYEIDNFNMDSATVSQPTHNLADNGSFEQVTYSPSLFVETLSGWAFSTYTGGTIQSDTLYVSNGARSLKFTSAGSGGGNVVSEAFKEVSSNRLYLTSFTLRSTVADVRNLVQVNWYDRAKALLSTSIVYDDATTNPTAVTPKYGYVTAPATATYAKLELYGCHPSDVTSGSTWFDSVIFTDLLMPSSGTLPGDQVYPGTASFTNNSSFTGASWVRESTTAGAAEGPVMDLRRTKNSVASDLLAQLRFLTRNSVSVEKEFACILAKVIDGTSTTEDGEILFRTIIAGAIAGRVVVGAGMYTPTATGGDKGVDTINAKALYDDNDMLIPGSVWSDLTGSRALNTNYQNTKGHPIFLSIATTQSSIQDTFLYCDSVSPPTGRRLARQNGTTATMFIMVPVSWYYRLEEAGGASINQWHETT